MSNEIHALSDLAPSQFPKFRKLKGLPPVPVVKTTSETIVFVHGIRSTHETFQKLANRLYDKGIKFPEFQFCYFDYDYRQSIAESGQKLAVELQGLSETGSQVTIVGHSMGGLVGRLAQLMLERVTMISSHGHERHQSGEIVLWCERKFL